MTEDDTPRPSTVPNDTETAEQRHQRRVNAAVSRLSLLADGLAARDYAAKAAQAKAVDEAIERLSATFEPSTEIDEEP
jgi:hypothetical protein